MKKDNIQQETIEFAVQIEKMLKKGCDIVAYTRTGAGKTTFYQSVRQLVWGLEDNVVSPTFSLVNEYRRKCSYIILISVSYYEVQTIWKLPVFMTIHRGKYICN